MSGASVISVRKALAQRAARRMALVRGRSMRENAAGGAAWTYLGLVTLVFVLFRTAGDRWWFATVLIYSPRWLYAAPLAVLLPGAALWNRRALVPLSLAAALIVFPIMDFCIPWSRAVIADGPRLRVITCNIEGGLAARQALTDLVVAEQADLVALEEYDPAVPLPWPEGWHVVHAGQLLVAARYPLEDVEHRLCTQPPTEWPPVDALRCRVNTPQGQVRFCCVHLQSPRPGLEQVLNRWTLVNPAKSWALATDTEYRRYESEEVAAWIAEGDEPVIIAGDFNMPSDSAIFRQFWSLWSDAFAMAGWGLGYTKITVKKAWTYGARIDHVLFDKSDFSCRDCRVAPDVGSDHLPLVADLVWQPAADRTPRVTASIAARRHGTR